MGRNGQNDSASASSGLSRGCVRKAQPSRWMTLVGLTLGCRGRRVVRSIKKWKLDPCSADWCSQLSWHVSETGCIVGMSGGGLALTAPVETVRGTRGRKWKRGCEGDEGLERGAALHSVLLHSAIEMKHSCVLILPNGPLLCQDYTGQVKGYRNRTGGRNAMSGCHKE